MTERELEHVDHTKSYMNSQRGISADSKYFFTLDADREVITLWRTPLTNPTKVIKIEGVVSAGFGSKGCFYIAKEYGKIQRWSVVDQPKCLFEDVRPTPQMIHAFDKGVLFTRIVLGQGHRHRSGAEAPAYMLPEHLIHEQSFKRLDKATRNFTFKRWQVECVGS